MTSGSDRWIMLETNRGGRSKEISGKLVERKGVSRRQDVTVDARREHDVAR